LLGSTETPGWIVNHSINFIKLPHTRMGTAGAHHKIKFTHSTVGDQLVAAAFVITT